ncbi:MAG: hypothetical protein A3F53_02680 [Candidatus Zambryskibacteria bacterium RIFCSPHIGHO2_12_FULL_48_10]|uniref:Uncharacterized protein n=1 Tax=Candidatus Zambryskibacteria bacterium RIFCSPHIGHO2_01_FULL_46_25 TaxID=1802738 RepID=A0A1G2SZ08_9BACT|nr:MAG: hypothetical protein A2838_01625 [Candidatus Zambryskibacteria bacterium RIFCSPHIGHO2_01_FULL_46_25]OHB02236.1 MAG: hypothetical protein A3F53_02680 [Candidatus Zambryskibacteria bacterium RIFCSPHIGHO2_12_FULL_48_10]OHB06825.1 MAG: hypothetical protein A3A31_00770 [Candidatus Zambryskibacteria bacterium RIFCSPLOWO2_01_FULL_48_25]
MPSWPQGSSDAQAGGDPQQAHAKNEGDGRATRPAALAGQVRFQKGQAPVAPALFLSPTFH